MRRLIATLTLAWGLVVAAALGASASALVWGGDSEGNVPFMFGDPKNDSQMIGFEVDLVDLISRELGREPQFKHNGWDSLIPGLNLGLYEMALSGLEVTPEHEEVVDFSTPYYRAQLQLVTEKGNPKNLQGLDDLSDAVVGTLKQSVAYDTLVEAGVKEIRTYENEINAYQDLAYGRLDAVFMDFPIAMYYASFNPQLEFVGEPVGEMDYAVAFKKGSPLRDQVNAALAHLKETGQLRDLYEKWNLWTPMMAQYFDDDSEARVGREGYDGWVAFQNRSLSLGDRLKRYVSFMPIFGKAALITLEVSICAMVLAILLGLTLAICRMFGPKPLRLIARGYIEFVRGTPVLIQLFFIFYGLPNIGITLTPFWAGVIGLGLNYAAYEAENYRAGLLSVPRQQMEGALALAMTRRQALRYVVVPQAIRVSLPPVTNDFISLLKDSSLVSMITLVDLTKAYGQLANTYYDYFGLGLLVAVIYFLLGLPFVRLARVVERRLAVAVGRNLGQKETFRAASFND